MGRKGAANLGPRNTGRVPKLMYKELRVPTVRIEGSRGEKDLQGSTNAGDVRNSAGATESLAVR